MPLRINVIEQSLRKERAAWHFCAKNCQSSSTKDLCSPGFLSTLARKQILRSEDSRNPEKKNLCPWPCAQQSGWNLPALHHKRFQESTHSSYSVTVPFQTQGLMREVQEGSIPNSLLNSPHQRMPLSLQMGPFLFLMRHPLHYREPAARAGISSCCCL